MGEEEVLAREDADDGAAPGVEHGQVAHAEGLEDAEGAGHGAVGRHGHGRDVDVGPEVEAVQRRRRGLERGDRGPRERRDAALAVARMVDNCNVDVVPRLTVEL